MQAGSAVGSNAQRKGQHYYRRRRPPPPSRGKYASLHAEWCAQAYRLGSGARGGIPSTLLSSTPDAQSTNPTHGSPSIEDVYDTSQARAALQSRGLASHTLPDPSHKMSMSTTTTTAAATATATVWANRARAQLTSHVPCGGQEDVRVCGVRRDV